MRNIRRPILNGVRFCKNCGTRMFFQGYIEKSRITRIMDNHKVCYECAFWRDLIDYPPKYMEVIGNKVWKVMPEVKEKDTASLLGSRGKMRYFMKPDHSVFKSNDVWFLGTIPERFVSELPPTLIEVQEKVYKAFSNFPSRCSARGCYDRYHCMRYKIELEKNKGAYNKVPEFWIVGNEHCKYFVNKSNIIIDYSIVPNKKVKKWMK